MTKRPPWSSRSSSSAELKSKGGFSNIAGVIKVGMGASGTLIVSTGTTRAQSSDWRSCYWSHPDCRRVWLLGVSADDSPRKWNCLRRSRNYLSPPF